MSLKKKNQEIKTCRQPFCYICGGQGKILYHGLTDRLFGVSGKWNVKQCLDKQCGLLWLDPIPIKKDISKTYVDYYTHSNTNNIPEPFVRRLINFIKFGYLARKYNYYLDFVNIWQKILGLFVYFDFGLKSEIDFEVMYLKSKPQGRLLDIGCGSGKFLILMQKLSWQVKGTEIDPKAVEMAKNNKLQVRLGEINEQKYPENFFDVITLNNVIEHVSDPLNIFLECRRILKNTGFLMIATPNAKSRIHNIYKDKWFNLDPPRHLYLFSPKNLEDLLEKAGFKTAKTWTTSRNLRSSLIGSWDIKKKNHHKMGSRQPLFVRIKAKFLQFIEEIILKIKSDMGDEIVLKAEKI